MSMTLRGRLNHQHNDVVTALGRMDEAREMLQAWISEYPESDLARMSRSLVERILASDP